MIVLRLLTRGLSRKLQTPPHLLLSRRLACPFQPLDLSREKQNPQSSQTSTRPPIDRRSKNDRPSPTSLSPSQKTQKLESNVSNKNDTSPLINLSDSSTSSGIGPQLRPYQSECIASILTAFNGGMRRVAYSLPPGSGKTRIFLALITLVLTPADLPSATRVLVLVQREELLNQIVAVLRQTLPHLNVQVEIGNKHAVVQGADVVVASVLSLGRAANDKSDRRRARFRAEDFKLVVTDEAHHTPAPIYQCVLQHLNITGADLDPTETATARAAAGKEILRKYAPLLLGCTATFFRHDNVALDMYEEIVYQQSLRELMEAGYLAPFHVKKVYTPDLTHVKHGDGDYNSKALSKILNTPHHNDMVVRAWRQLARGRKSTLLFCVGVDHMKSMTAAFRAQGVDARYISGETSRGERAHTLKRFANGNVPVLINVDVFTEGTDLPCIDCIVFVRPTRSQGLFEQMRGRGLRLHPGKKDCLFLDFVGNFERLEPEGEALLTGRSILDLAETATANAESEMAAHAVELPEPLGEEQRPSVDFQNARSANGALMGCD